MVYCCEFDGLMSSDYLFLFAFIYKILLIYKNYCAGWTWFQEQLHMLRGIPSWELRDALIPG